MSMGGAAISTGAMVAEGEAGRPVRRGQKQANTTAATPATAAKPAKPSSTANSVPAQAWRRSMRRFQRRIRRASADFFFEFVIPIHPLIVS